MGAKVEASIGRYKRVVGDRLRSRTAETEAVEVAIAAAALTRMLEFGRSNSLRIAQATGISASALARRDPCNTVA